MILLRIWLFSDNEAELKKQYRECHTYYGNKRLFIFLSVFHFLIGFLLSHRVFKHLYFDLLFSSVLHSKMGAL